MTRGAVLVAAVVTLASATVPPGPIHTDVPAKPDPAARYLIYLHGRILELEGRKAVSPDFGAYRYDAILEALAARGLVVISEVRNFDAGDAFVQKVAGQVRRLLAAGVPARNVTVAGFSKGGGLAVGVAAALANPDVGYVFMAGCSKQPEWVRRRAGVKGRLLSLYEASDRFEPSCAPLFAEAAGVAAKKEIVIRSGLDHGHFYAPRADWVDAVSDWALRTP
jgi:dienelactone hydrolase